MHRSLLAVAALVFALSGCSGTSIKQEPDQPGSGETTEAAPEPKKAAKVGDTITLRGNEEGLTIAVTVVKVVDPAKSKDEYSVPQEGNRYVAVQFTLKNVGEVAYGDTPGNGAKLVDTEGQGFDSTFADTRAGPSMSSDVKLARGNTSKGFITFEVPKASKVQQVQFTLESGFGPETGEWTLT
jgi:hypothetical protein